MPTTAADVPQELIVDYDIYDHARAEVVHTELAEIRERHRVAWTNATGGYWIATRAEDMHAILRNPEVFSSAGVSIAPFPGKVIPGQLDPPEHTAFRQVLGPLFSPQRLAPLEPRIRSIAVELIDAFIGRGEVALLEEFAHPLPTRLFLAMMGWPQEDAPIFTEWTQRILVVSTAADDEAKAADGQQAAAEVFAYFGKVVARVRENPGDDFTSHLATIRLHSGEPIGDDELLHLLFELMLGGLHTVRAALGFTMVELARHPEQRRKLIDDPDLIPGAVEEALRFESGVAVGRLVTRVVTIGEVTMQPGDRVCVPIWGANRDPALFECPNELRVDRSPNRHLAFSGGPHRCVGSHLARIEMRVALEELLRRLPDYEIDPDKPLSYLHGQVRGLEELYLRFTPGGRA
jgi:cytochrome P450